MAVEKKVAKTYQIKEGQIKEVSVGKKSILLVRLNGKLHAIGSRCTHRGAPLREGALYQHHVRCPWHQACFDAITGDIKEPPALDALPHFELRTEGEDVIVSLPEDIPIRRSLPMAKHRPDHDNRRFVIVGAGAAGAVAAETLREDGFEGRIIMITKENCLPYDRTLLTKGYLTRSSSAVPTLRPDDFYSRHDIETITQGEVISADPSQKTVVLDNSSSLGYDKLLIATGSVPRSLPVPGSDLKNVFTLRGIEDAHNIKAAVKEAKRAVVVGASFIGTEAAAALVQHGVCTTVVALESVPFELILGKRVGKLFQVLHEEKGISFRLGAKISSFQGTGKVKQVILEDGEKLKADVVLLGVGAAPTVPSIKGVEVNSDGSLSVNKYLQAAEDIYAAGDIARFPHWRTGEPIRVEHWQLAQQQGRVAAHNMAGENKVFDRVPFFWTGQFDLNLRYVGHTKKWDDIIFQGNPEQRNFVAFYIKDDQIMAAAGCNNDTTMAAITELMGAGKMPDPAGMQKDEVNLINLLKE